MRPRAGILARPSRSARLRPGKRRRRTLPSDAGKIEFDPSAARGLEAQRRGSSSGRWIQPAGRIAAAEARGTEPALCIGDTVFEIGSITKVFTAALLSDMAAARGQLSRTRSRNIFRTRSVPARRTEAITLLALATQSSGLPRLPDNLAPRDPKNPNADYTVEKMYEFLSRYELTRDSARSTSTRTSARAARPPPRAASGDGLRGPAHKRILAPLKMRDTGIACPGDARAPRAGHDAKGGEVPNWDLPTLAGAGALRSTVRDLLTFVEASLSRSKGRSSERPRETQRVRRATGIPHMDIGLAWHIIHRFDVDLVWHNGAGAAGAPPGWIIRAQSGPVTVVPLYSS